MSNLSFEGTGDGDREIGGDGNSGLLNFGLEFGYLVAEYLCRR